MFGEIRACLKQGTFDFILSAICNQISNIWLTVSYSYIKSHIAFNIIRKISKKWDCAYSMPGSISQDYTRCLFMQSLSGGMRQLVRGAPSETGNQMEGWAQCPLSLLLSWYCLQIYSCSCTTQRNSIREDKAKQTKMVTMDIGKMVPCCWTPLQVSSCGKKTGSSSPSQPAGPLSHQAPTEPKLWPW